MRDMILQLTYFLGLRLHETMSLRIRDLNQPDLYVHIEIEILQVTDCHIQP